MVAGPEFVIATVEVAACVDFVTNAAFEGEAELDMVSVLVILLRASEFVELDEVSMSVRKIGIILDEIEELLRAVKACELNNTSTSVRKTGIRFVEIEVLL